MVNVNRNMESTPDKWGRRKEIFFEEHPWLPNMLKVLSYVGYAVIACLIVTAGTLRLGSITPMSVVSNSMVPTFQRGDLILVSKDYSSLAVGDVVVYHQTPQNRDVVHRIKDISGNEIQVQGDANPVPDPVFQRSAIRGEVAGIIPKAGYIFMPKNTVPLILATILLTFITDEWRFTTKKKQRLGRHSTAYFANLGKNQGEESV